MKKVIIAEDVYSILKKEKSFLNRFNISLSRADSNGKILALHKAEKADLIIATLDTPGMSGEKLCSLIRGDAGLQSVSIIIVSSDRETDTERCIKCNANTFISTPINTAVLLQEAHRLLNIAPRMSCRIPISVKLYGTSGGKPFSGYTENISLSGMLFRSSAVMFEGDAIECVISLPDFTQIKASAEIMRVIPKKQDSDVGYGVSFTDIGAEDVLSIRAFVNQNAEVRLKTAPVI